METSRAFIALGIALALGLLVGLQRERAGSRRAGLRTFPLITLLGAATALLAEHLGPWPFAAGLLGVVAAFVVSNLVQHRAAVETGTGMTTEIAMLLMCGVGALCVLAPWEIATAIGGVVLLLLEWKAPLHALARRLGDKDVHAIVRFVLIAFVILPLLPDRTVGPFDVLNPRRIWLVVVLVVGIGLAAYVARRSLGARIGSAVSGVFGGLVSSTATTAGVGRQVANGLPRAEAVLIVSIASAMVVPRQLIEISAVAPAALESLWLPLGSMLVGFAVPIGVAWRLSAAHSDVDVPEPSNPAALGPALWFAFLFSVVLLGAAFAQEQFGSGGLHAVAFLSGTTDVDAITISTAGALVAGRVDAANGAIAILIASVVNLACKAGIAGALGGAAMLRATALAFALPVVAGLGWIAVLAA